jgi:hypothetical protein
MVSTVAGSGLVAENASLFRAESIAPIYAFGNGISSFWTGRVFFTAKLGCLKQKRILERQLCWADARDSYHFPSAQ